MTLAGSPFAIDVRAVPGAADASAALDALDRLGVGLAHVGPGRPLGDGWPAACERWAGRLRLHHACLDAPDAPRWNLAARDEAVRATAIAGASHALRVAADLGAPYYSLHAGWALTLTCDERDRPVGPTETAARARDQLCRSLDGLASLADGLGLRLLVETAADWPDERAVFGDPEAMVAVLERLAAPPLGLLFDTAAIVATAHRRGEHPEPFAQFLAPHVAATRVHARGGQRTRWLPLREEGVELGLLRELRALDKPLVYAAREVSAAQLDEQLLMIAERGQPPGDARMGPRERGKSSG